MSSLYKKTSGGDASPLTTKGDVYTYSTADARLPVGTDGHALFADSGEATGLDWKPVTASAGGADTNVQFNDTGVLEGDAEFIYNKNTTDPMVTVSTADTAGSATIRVAADGGSLDSIVTGSTDTIPDTSTIVSTLPLTIKTPDVVNIDSENIVIKTGDTADAATGHTTGDILIRTGDGDSGNTGDVTIKAGDGSDASVFITAANGAAMSAGGDVIITAGAGGGGAPTGPNGFVELLGGNVGVGKSSPSYPLDVAGVANFDLGVACKGDPTAVAFTGKYLFCGYDVANDFAVAQAVDSGVGYVELDIEGAPTKINMVSGGDTEFGGTTTLNAITYTWPVADAAGVLNSDGAGTLSWGGASIEIGTSTIVGGTPGSVLFIDSGGFLGEDNAKFFWDDTNDYLGIGTAAPASAVDVVGAINTDTALTVTVAGPIVTTINTTYMSVYDGGGSAYSGFNIDTGTLGINTTSLADVSFGAGVTFGGTTTLNSVTYTWPAADAAFAGYVLTSNAAGTLTWEQNLSYGVTPVADGTYTMGLGVTQNGTITTVNGIITAVQEVI